MFARIGVIMRRVTIKLIRKNAQRRLAEYDRSAALV
jgi:hypothetical protein